MTRLTGAGFDRLSHAPVNRHDAHSEQLHTNFGGELKMPMPFHCLDEDRNEWWLQTLAADPIRRPPKPNKRLADIIAVIVIGQLQQLLSLIKSRFSLFKVRGDEPSSLGR